MLKLFQRDMILQALLVVAALLLLWLRPLVAPEPMVAGDHPAAIYGLLCRWLAPLPRLAAVLAMLLVLLEGVMLNLLLANVNLVSQNSLLPTLLYIVALSAGTSTLSPIILVSGLTIACLHFLVLRGSLLTIPPEKICGATLLIGLATFIYQPAVLLMLSYLLIAANYRLYNGKDLVLMLLGFAAPYALLLLILYMLGTLGTWWEDTCLSFTPHTLHSPLSSPHSPLSTLLSPLLLAAILLWSLLHVLGHTGERPVVWQKNATTVLLLTFGGVGMLLFHGMKGCMALFAIPFAFCCYRMLVHATEKPMGFGRRKRNTWIYDILLVLILVAALLC